jgi:hypothetical protein
MQTKKTIIAEKTCKKKESINAQKNAKTHCKTLINQKKL